MTLSELRELGIAFADGALDDLRLVVRTLLTQRIATDVAHPLGHQTIAAFRFPYLALDKATLHTRAEV